MGLTARGNIPLLLNHQTDQPVGTVTFGNATPKGLPFTAKITKIDEPGEVKTRTDTAWHSVKSGIIKGVSIGFIPRESTPSSSGGTHFTRGEVYELSLTAVPANPDAVITTFKSVQPIDHKAGMIHNPLAEQIRKAVAMSHSEALIASSVAGITKEAVPAAAIGNTPALYYPTQTASVLLPPTTPPIVSQLAALGAPQLPPNVRLLTQALLLQASEIAEGDPTPAAAPGVDFALTSLRKFGLICTFSNALLAPVNLTDAVVQYVQDQLEAAANNATDAFMVALMTTSGAAAGTVAAAMTAFAGDLRTACWIGNPGTLASLRSAQETDIGPRGGSFYQLPALASLAVPDGKLILQDIKRIAVFDGPQYVARSIEADIVMDSDPKNATSKPVRLFQENMTALKIIKYADAKLIAVPQIVTVGA